MIVQPAAEAATTGWLAGVAFAVVSLIAGAGWPFAIGALIGCSMVALGCFVVFVWLDTAEAIRYDRLPPRERK